MNFCEWMIRNNQSYSDIEKNLFISIESIINRKYDINVE